MSKSSANVSLSYPPTLSMASRRKMPIGPGTTLTVRQNACALRTMFNPSMYSSACSFVQMLCRLITFTFPATAPTCGSRK